MDKPTVILADTDYGYLEALELSFVERFGNEIELVVITRPDYFSQYFQELKQAQLLVVSEELYGSELHRHEIAHVIILSESSSAPPHPANAVWMNKYTKTKLILGEAERALQGKQGNLAIKKGTKVIGVSSAAGGAGKTAVALGLAYALASQNRSVLFLSTEQMQSFSVFLDNRETLGTDAYRVMRKQEEDCYAGLRSRIRKEKFHYLPPVGATLDSLQISFSVYGKIAKQAREQAEYDYIILDMDSGCGGREAQLMKESDHVLLVLQQDAMSVAKNNFMLRNMDYSEKEKYVFLCNRFDGDRKNWILEPGNEQITVSEYLPELEQDFNLHKIGSREEIRNLAFLFM